MALRTVFHQVSKTYSSSISALAARDYSTKFVNHVQLLGRVGKEPAKVGENDAVAFPFYTESTIKLKDGSFKNYPCWHRILVPRKTLADTVFESVERGQRCFVSGRIAYKAATVNEEGKLQHSQQAVIICDHIVFLEKSKKREEAAGDLSYEKPKEAAVN